MWCNTYLYNYDYGERRKKWNRVARERRVFSPISFKNKVLAGPFIERLFAVKTLKP